MAKHSCQHNFQKNFQIEYASVDAAAIFGSYARGDADRLSDKDLLLIGNDIKGLRLAATRLDYFGWSCSTYTWLQLSQEVKRRSLFIQHLRLEGVVIKDTSERLFEMLYGAEPRSDYSWEAEQAKDLIGLIEYIPNNDWGSIWALDVLMVGFRSFGYAVLANEGIFHFSFDEVLRNLKKINLLKSSDLHELQSLRKCKHYYRENPKTLHRTNNRIISLMSIIDKRIKLDIHISFMSPELFTVRQGAKIENSGHWYKKSRALEAVTKLFPEKFDETFLQKLCNLQGYSLPIRKLNSQSIIAKALSA